jgi:DNA-binding transcriptional LysR family regulator
MRNTHASATSLPPACGCCARSRRRARSRPEVRYVVRDWLAKLHIVAAGLAITTLAPVAAPALPDGVTAVAVRGDPQATRRLVLARPPGRLEGPAARFADALITAA